MGIDIVLVQLAIVFLPGLIWAQIDARYAAKEKAGQVQFIIRAFLFGMFSYLVVFIGYGLFRQSFSVLDIDAARQTGILLGHFADEILISIPVTLVLAVLWVYAATYKLLHRLLLWMRATKKYGDEDVWDYTFNSPGEEVEYVHVRDFDRGTTYAGWVRAFSATGRQRELLLRDVIVYDKDRGSSVPVPLLYLARDGESIHIEFPYRRAERREGEERSGGE